MTAPADLRADRCARCDDPACDVPASAAAYYSLDFATAAKGDIVAARDRNGEAHDECYTRKAKDWRAEAMELRADLVALQREADRLRHGDDREPGANGRDLRVSVNGDDGSLRTSEGAIADGRCVAWLLTNREELLRLAVIGQGVEGAPGREGGER